MDKVQDSSGKSHYGTWSPAPGLNSAHLVSGDYDLGKYVTVHDYGDLRECGYGEVRILSTHTGADGQIYGEPKGRAGCLRWIRCVHFQRFVAMSHPGKLGVHGYEATISGGGLVLKKGARVLYEEKGTCVVVEGVFKGTSLHLDTRPYCPCQD